MAWYESTFLKLAVEVLLLEVPSRLYYRNRFCFRYQHNSSEYSKIAHKSEAIDRVC